MRWSLSALQLSLNSRGHHADLFRARLQLLGGASKILGPVLNFIGLMDVDSQCVLGPGLVLSSAMAAMLSLRRDRLPFTFNLRKLGNANPEALNRFHDGGQSFTAWRLCDVPVSVIVVCGVDWLRAWIECSIHRDRHAERAEDPPNLSSAGIPLLSLLLSAIVGG
jgi:hypothetical protein